MPLPCQVPTCAELTTFIQTFLPPYHPTTITTTRKDSTKITTIKSDVPFYYHTPRRASCPPTHQLTSKVIFSVTPTAGVYSALGPPPSSAHHNRSPVVFVHRPWALDRRAVPHDATVLASHISFDTHLTVGWNVALAAKLNIELASATCIKGYKDDPERKLGLVGKLCQPTSLAAIAAAVKGEFGGFGELFEHAGHALEASDSHVIEAVAIMNAFSPDEVGRVLDTVRASRWIDDARDGRRVLYLTGAPRAPGLEAAAKANMPAFCVGHRACEEWGIRYLAQVTRERWPGLDVITVLEEEEPRSQ